MNSRQLAQEWPYPRHKKFVNELRSVAANWFALKQFTINPKMEVIKGQSQIKCDELCAMLCGQIFIFDIIALCQE